MAYIQSCATMLSQLYIGIQDYVMQPVCHAGGMNNEMEVVRLNALRKRNNELLDMIRKSNERVNELVIQHDQGMIEEETFWKELEKESTKSQEIRNMLLSVRRELAIEEMSKKKW